MLAFMKWNMMMLSKRKHLIFMVLFNVLLINCGYVQARPNASATIGYGSEDKTNVRIIGITINYYHYYNFVCSCASPSYASCINY